MSKTNITTKEILFEWSNIQMQSINEFRRIILITQGLRNLDHEMNIEEVNVNIWRLRAFVMYVKLYAVRLFSYQPTSIAYSKFKCSRSVDFVSLFPNILSSLTQI